MPRTVTKTVYSFRELIELAKTDKHRSTAVERVRTELSTLNADAAHISAGVWEGLWEEALKQIGFVDAELRWSGFYSQGDGASFTAGCDVHKLLHFLSTDIQPSETIDDANMLPWVVHKLEANFGYDPSLQDLIPFEECLEAAVESLYSDYVHARSCRASVAVGSGDPFDIATLDSPECQKLINAFETSLEQLRFNISQTIYQDLDKENDLLTSDEALIDLDECNAYAWDIYGHQEYVDDEADPQNSEAPAAGGDLPVPACDGDLHA